MALRIKYDNPYKGKYAKDVEEHQQRMARAITTSFRDGAKLLQAETRSAILSAGLGPRFARQFRAFGFPRRQFSLEPTIRGWHARGWKGAKAGRWANIHVRGATMSGKPLLWIPLPTAPARIAGKAPSPKLYIENIGPLVKLKGTRRPLLAGDSLRAISGRHATVAQLKTGAKHAQARASGGKGRKTVKVPMFVGVASTHVPGRVNMDAIFARVRERLPDLFVARLKAQK
jgi:hypothetical protein